jgi:Rrf2 family transcriptional regulator, cysteine metabolism repressor
MMFSTRSEYGVRVMIALGRRREEGPVSLADIATAEGLPLSYLEHLIARLREAGLVQSTRGAHGGYELGRGADDITMAEVVAALEGGSMAPMQCLAEPGEMRVLCNHELDGFEHCATRLLWTRVQGGITRALEQTTLAELVEFADHGVTAKKTSQTKTKAKSKSRSAAGRSAAATV